MTSSALQAIRLGDVFEVSNERLGEYVDEPPVFAISKYDGVVLGAEYHDRRVASDKLNTYKVLGSADWAYSTIHIDEGSIARNNHGFLGVVSPMYTILRWISNDHDPRYFEYLLRSPEMLATYGDMAQGSINRRRSLPWKSFSSIAVSVPSLEEQQRIVDLLGVVDDAIDRADYQIGSIATLLSAAQSDSPTGPEVPFGELLEGIDSGISSKPSEADTVGAPVGILKVSAVRPARFQPQEIKPVGAMQLPERARVAEGDLLMTRSNTPGTVGYVCIARGVPSNSFMPDLIWRMRVDETRVTRSYLEHYLSSLPMRGAITSSATGTSESMRKVNKRGVSLLPISVPSLDDQDKYSNFCDSIRTTLEAARNSTSKLRGVRTELLSSLLSGAHRIPETYDELMGA